MKISKQTVHAALDELLSRVSLSPWEKQRMVHVALAAGRQQRRNPVLRRIMATAMMMVLCVAFSMVVLASPDLSYRLGQLSRTTLNYLSPAVGSCEKDGLRMEVLAAMNDGEDMVAYFALSDTTGQNRLAEGADLCDLRFAGAPYSLMYDMPVQQADGTLVFRVQGQADPAALAGGKATLQMDTVLAGCDSTGYRATGYTVADVLAFNASPALAGNLQTYDAVLYSYDNSLEQAFADNSLRGLRAVTEYVDERAPFLTFRNAGVVDGALHILADPDDAAWYNMVEFALYDGAGEPILTDTAVLNLGQPLAKAHPQSDLRTGQVEYVLALPADVPPEDVHVYYSLTTYDHCIPQKWDVTFAVQQAYAGITAVCDLDMRPWRLTGVEVSPIGYTVHGAGTQLETSLCPQVELVLADGTIKADSTGSVGQVRLDPAGGPDVITMKNYFDEPLDTDTVAAIRINGRTVWQAED